VRGALRHTLTAERRARLTRLFLGVPSPLDLGAELLTLLA
jgi:hypothetical protein